METYIRKAKINKTIKDGEKTFKLIKGKEYHTSRSKQGEVHVFSTYWVWLPASWFKLIRRFT